MATSPGMVRSDKETNVSSLPPIAPKYRLGKLCKRHHDWHGTGRSYRSRSNGNCIECDRERDRRRNADREKNRMGRHRAMLNEIKLAQGCADCGYRTHAVALHFDHLPGKGKMMGISQMWRKAGLRDKVIEEISKCEVVCANCHAVRTAQRREEHKDEQ